MRALHVRLLVVLVAILVPAGALLVVTALGAARSYHAEVTQRQNVDLARNLVHENLDLRAAGEVAGAAGQPEPDAAELDDLIAMMAMANPGVEIYLLDAAGQVVRAPDGVDVAAGAVDLTAVDRFQQVAGAGSGFPVLGTDPRRGGRAPFSAAPLADGGGYLYVVLTDEARSSLLRSVQSSTTLRLVLWGGGIGFAVVLLTGAAAFALLTRRLRRLDEAVRRFDPVTAPLSLPVVDVPRDEIDALAVGFAALGARVRAQIEALEHADRARRELITNVSHDLRTPLTSLRAALEAAEMTAASAAAAASSGATPRPDTTPRPDRELPGTRTPRPDHRSVDMDPTALARTAEHHLATARRSAERLARQIDQLFELSTLEGDEPPLHLEPFPLADLVHDVAQKFAPRADRYGVELELDAPPSLPFAFGDLGLVERALSNLIDNALRHVDDHGQVIVIARTEGDRAIIEVRDDGEGLDPELHERVFERFFRGERARGGERTGLGLAIVRRVAELHGGASGVTSEPSQGARFWFSLPLAEPRPPTG